MQLPSTFFALFLLLATICTSAMGQASAAEGLPPLELAIGENFEIGLAKDAEARRYMVEFSDPQFFARTSKLRKIWGRATVHDGETLSIGKEKIRLHGIKAPDISQTCRQSALNLQFDAGGFALGRLKSLASSDKAVVCYVEKGEPPQGTCFIWGLPGPINISRLLVRQGAAWAAPPDSSPYVRDEGWAAGAASRDRDPASKNLWHTDCLPPWKQKNAR